MPAGNAPPVSKEGLPETTLHVRRAVEGDPESLSWVVTHFTPLLLAQARYRLSRHLQGRFDPEDLVQRVWLITLPRLKDLVPRDGRFTPVLLRFLSSTLLQDYRNLLASHASRPPEVVPEVNEGDASGAPPALDPPATTSSAAAKAVRGERVRQLGKAMEALSDEDREIIVLRGIEQLSYEVIAAKLSVATATLRVRYHRALQRLRKFLPASIIDEMET
jgi:RNA polymerase sigma-70 factor (ECF subfamily)